MSYQLVNILRPARMRWDFRTGEYYYLLKPEEARGLGLALPEGVEAVRVYARSITQARARQTYAKGCTI
jgi:hypothetical protein